MGVVIFIGIIIVVYFIAFANRKDKTVYRSVEDYRAGPRNEPVINKPVNTPLKSIKTLVDNIKSLDSEFSIVSQDSTMADIKSSYGDHKFSVYRNNDFTSTNWTYRDTDGYNIILNWHEPPDLSNKECFERIKTKLTPHKTKFRNFN